MQTFAPNGLNVELMHLMHLRTGRGRGGDSSQEEQEGQIEEELIIINLSTYQLSTVETDVLKRGLSFCPTSPLNKFILTKDLYFFCSRLALAKIHSGRPAQNSSDLNMTLLLCWNWKHWRRNILKIPAI